MTTAYIILGTESVSLKWGDDCSMAVLFVIGFFLSFQADNFAFSEADPVDKGNFGRTGSRESFR